MKKKLVLIALFVLPVVAYLFFSSGVYNFAKLPIITEKIADVTTVTSREIKTSEYSSDTPLTLKDHVSIVGYLGDNLTSNIGYTANLNLMIYKYFLKYEDFQMILFVSPGSEQAISDLKIELGRIFDVTKIRFVQATKEQAKAHFESLRTPLSLSPNGSHPNVFVVDRALALRSGHEDKKPNAYGYDMTQAVEMGYMKDDIKILLAEYRLALKKNNNASDKIEQRREKK
ncbi:hypothetical protein [uncultured Dokdonia sp.]|uniref:hypothetical protein n=1 Tax=uncultured Dokdonia sp. TaxID=575653 RepID=UPI0026252019|nr:hypothetical protein [uncultured Dokdonia sp.]